MTRDFCKNKKIISRDLCQVVKTETLQGHKLKIFQKRQVLNHYWTKFLKIPIIQKQKCLKWLRFQSFTGFRRSTIPSFGHSKLCIISPFSDKVCPSIISEYDFQLIIPVSKTVELPVSSAPSTCLTSGWDLFNLLKLNFSFSNAIERAKMRKQTPNIAPRRVSSILVRNQ